MGYRLQVPGECEERISDSVAPEHLRGSCQPGPMPRGALLVVLPRLRRADVASTTPPAPRLGVRSQVPGECEERLSDSVAPEHLPGAGELNSVKILRRAGRLADVEGWLNQPLG